MWSHEDCNTILFFWLFLSQHPPLCFIHLTLLTKNCDFTFVSKSRSITEFSWRWWKYHPCLFLTQIKKHKKHWLKKVTVRGWRRVSLLKEWIEWQSLKSISFILLIGQMFTSCVLESWDNLVLVALFLITTYCSLLLTKSSFWPIALLDFVFFY